MNTLQIPMKGIYKEYPSMWEEISRKDVPYIGKWLYMLETGALDVDMFRKLVVDRFINRRNSKRMPMEGAAALDLWANEWQLAETVNFFFKITKGGKDLKDSKEVKVQKEEPERYEVIPDFVKNLVPWIRLRGRKYYGPGDFLGEMTFGEYKDLLYCADKFMQTKEEYWLTRMMAISYRPRRLFLWIIKRLATFDGRLRREYMAGAVDIHENRFAGVPIGIKYMYFQYVMGCIYTLKTDAGGPGVEIDGKNCFFSLVFSKKGPERTDEEEEQDSGVGLTGVIMALAESGVFGDIEKTSEANVWAVLIRLYQLELQRREIERKMK